MTGGQLALARTFGLIETGAVLPLTWNPTPFGTNNPDVSTAEVQGLYQIVLGRAADPTGLDAAVSYLKGGGQVSQVASNLLHSAEYYTDLAIADYRNFLGRTPSQPEINAVVAALQGSLTAEGLAQDLLSSQEFSQENASNTAFVQQAYRDTLSREATPAEVSEVVALLGSGLTRPGLIQSLLNSSEADTRSMNGLYQTILARGTDPGGLTFWVNALQAGTPLVDVAINFFGSDEFQGRANATVG